MSEKSGPIVRIDTGQGKHPIDASFDVVRDLIETVDTELALQAFEPLPNPTYEFRPYILPRKTLQLAVVRLIEIDGGQLEQKTEFDCAVDSDTHTFYLAKEREDGKYESYPVEPNPMGTFAMFQMVAMDRAIQMN